MDIDLFSESMQRDQDQVFDLMRTRAPVYWSEQVRAWILTRHADYALVLHDPRFTRNQHKHEEYQAPPPGSSPRPIQRLLDDSIVQVEPPRHNRLRKLVSKALTPRAIEAQRPAIQAIIDDCLAEIPRHEPVDLVSGLMARVPIRVVARMLEVTGGAGEALFDRLRRALIPLTFPRPRPEDLDAADEAVLSLEAFLDRVIDERGKQLGDDILSRLIVAEDAGDVLTKGELIALAVAIVTAGVENVSILMTHGVVALMQHPEVRETLREEPELWPNAVWELLRYASAGGYVRRFALQDVTLRGQQIRRGQMLLGAVHGVHRDPEVYVQPHRFDIRRPPGENLMFGKGMHYCIGASLARNELELVMRSLVDRFPALRLEPDGLEYGHEDPMVPFLRRVTVTLEPRPRGR